MKHWARVNEGGFLQVRHSGTKPLHPDYVEVDAEVAKEPSMYVIREGKTQKKPPICVDAILAARRENERRQKKMEELLKS